MQEIKLKINLREVSSLLQLTKEILKLKKTNALTWREMRRKNKLTDNSADLIKAVEEALKKNQDIVTFKCYISTKHPNLILINEENQQGE